MKSDSLRLGYFTLGGIQMLRGNHPEGLQWMFEGFVPYRITEQINMDARLYFGWHPDFEMIKEGYPAPEYVPERVDGKTVWRRA